MLLEQCLPGVQEALGSIPIPHKPGVVVCAGNLSALEVQIGESEMQGHP